MNHLTADPFLDREWSVDELSHMMLEVPNIYTMITQLGIFGDPIPLPNRYVGIEIQGMTLTLLQTTQWGGPATKGSVGKRKRHLFEIPHTAHEDLVTGAEIQDLRGFGVRAPMMFEDLVGRKLATMALKHYLTHEWRRIGALKGLIVDADGSTLYDLFSIFNVVQHVADFSSGGWNQNMRDTDRYMEANLNGDRMTGTAYICSTQFMDALLEDTDIKASYNAAAALTRQNPNLDDVRKMFVHQNKVFMEYNATFPVINQDGTADTVKAVADGEAIVFPIGTLDSASSYAAPADFIDTVNTPGLLMYARERFAGAPGGADGYNRNREFHTQSNFLPLWRRPKLLVKATVND